jgi:hypothetical protein
LQFIVLDEKLRNRAGQPSVQRDRRQHRSVGPRIDRLCHETVISLRFPVPSLLTFQHAHQVAEHDASSGYSGFAKDQGVERIAIPSER